MFQNVKKKSFAYIEKNCKQCNSLYNLTYDSQFLVSYLKSLTEATYIYVNIDIRKIFFDQNRNHASLSFDYFLNFIPFNSFI